MGKYDIFHPNRALILKVFHRVFEPKGWDYVTEEGIYKIALDMDKEKENFGFISSDFIEKAIDKYYEENY